MIGKSSKYVWLVIGATFSVAPVDAQTRSTKETARAYGARITADSVAGTSNPLRVNNRVSGRIENRINLRIQRYNATRGADPGATFSVSRDDGTQRNPNRLFARTGRSSTDEGVNVYGALEQDKLDLVNTDSVDQVPIE